MERQLAWAVVCVNFSAWFQPRSGPLQINHILKLTPNNVMFGQTFYKHNALPSTLNILAFSSMLSSISLLNLSGTP